MDGDGGEPTYPLPRVITLTQQGRMYPSKRAALDALGMKFDAEDIRECLLGLCRKDFHKTDESTDMPGVMLDVYLLVYRGKLVYVKVRITPQAWTKVVSFHRGD